MLGTVILPSQTQVLHQSYPNISNEFTPNLSCGKSSEEFGLETQCFKPKKEEMLCAFHDTLILIDYFFSQG